MPPKKQPAAPTALASPLIPLHCLLCPKRPSFSDVSHLLTHISSKSHLSNRFKTEIRSQQEGEARETLRQFNDWYRHYGINDLLADRMSAKDKKNAPKRKRAQSPAGKSRSYEDEVMIKPDPEPLARRSTNESLHAHSARHGSSLEGSPYATPVPRHLRRIYPSLGTPGHYAKTGSIVLSVESELEVAEDVLPDDDADEVVQDEDPDRAKLKGVFWPGMSLFDSATAEQKRKRNQRKDVAVVKNMEQVAACVQPTECIWSEDISLQRSRDIYATPSPIGSPEPEPGKELPPKKKRARRTKATNSAAEPRPTRTSARISRAKRILKSSDNLDSYTPDDDVKREDDDSATTTSNLDSERVKSPPQKSTGDTFDIFRDPPGLSPPGPGQFAAVFQFYYDTQCVSPALTGASAGTESSTNIAKYEPAARQPLQRISSNTAISSPTNGYKTMAALRRGQSDFGIQVEPSSGGHHYGNHHGLAPSNYNTLFGTNSRHAFSYTPPHYSQSFAADGRPLGSGFQPINGFQYDHNPYQIAGGAPYFPAPSGYPDTNDYDT